ncbi:MAG: OmpH family outer membrane protein [Acidobacteria bacterium]|nr:OmpH family outer membrane protein [Acidobacteriota bacterium]
MSGFTPRHALPVLAGLIAFSGAAFAQTKVAVINLQRAIIETAEIKKASAELEAKYRPRQQKMQEVEKELNGVQAQLQAGQGKLTQAQEAELQSKGQRAQRELQRLGEDLQADVDRERQEILQRAGGRMTDVVKKLAEEKGFDIVVEASNAIFFKASVEVTNEAIAAYDKTFPAK